MKFSKKHADRAVEFIGYLTHTKGEWAGQPFKLLPWQKKIISDIFGTLDDDGLRQYRKAYIEIPKKQWKSELAAAVALYLLVADREPGAEVYSAAADREQASLVFNVAAQMVRNNPDLDALCDVRDSVKRIYVKSTNSFYAALSADVPTKHGINASGIIFDELHAQETRQLWDVLTFGSGSARRQPLLFAITTAGIVGESPVCEEQHQYALDIINGVKENPRFYPVIYSLPLDADWTEEENWLKVNPSIGHTVSLQTLRDEFKEAMDLPSRQTVFRQLRLNQWLQQEHIWLDLRDWDKCKAKIDWAEMQHQRCFLGMDLSSVSDLTCIQLTFPMEDGKHRMKWHYFIPEETMREHIRNDQVPYDRWIEDGWVTATPGNVVDLDFIEAYIEEQASLYEIQEGVYDPWRAQQVVEHLQQKGLTMVELPQTLARLAGPTAELERRVKAGLIEHEGDPVTRWCISCTAVKPDANGNIRPVKPDSKTSKKRIDGTVAAIMAESRAMTEQLQGVLYFSVEGG